MDGIRKQNNGTVSGRLDTDGRRFSTVCPDQGTAFDKVQICLNMYSDIITEDSKTHC